jgi:hypothetical protein
MPLMESKDRFNAFMRLADIRLYARNSRYQTQIRLTVGLWAVLAAGTVYIKNRSPEAFLITMLVIVVLGQALAVKRAQLRNQTDAAIAGFYVDNAENILFERSGPEVKPKTTYEMTWVERWLRPHRDDYWSFFLWVGPTVLMARSVFPPGSGAHLSRFEHSQSGSVHFDLASGLD